jgi:hypothetical protein
VPRTGWSHFTAPTCFRQAEFTGVPRGDRTATKSVAKEWTNVAGCSSFAGSRRMLSSETHTGGRIALRLFTLGSINLHSKELECSG